jgi:hypothetical protein
MGRGSESKTCRGGHRLLNIVFKALPRKRYAAPYPDDRCRFASYLGHSRSDYLAHYRSYCALADPEKRLEPRISAGLCTPHIFSPQIRSRAPSN